MQKLLLVILGTIVWLAGKSQQTIRLDIKSLPSYHSAGSGIYIAGSFNGWNPQHPQYKFHQDKNGVYSLSLPLNPGNYEYKITRGGWDKVECTQEGAGISNRPLKVEGDAVVDISVDGWLDHFPATPRKSTAGRQVNIIDSAFWIPQLQRSRRIWVCLPENHERTKYPVLYMHDGQNLFDDLTSFSGEWGVDEFMDTERLGSCIVVGIDHGGNKRMNEYNPYDSDRFGKGEGDAYVDFIVKTLKPFIDRKYNTQKGRVHTFIAGSSMGGLISMYAVLKYPKVFGGAGVFSPAFWVAPAIYKEAEKKGEKVKAKIYFYAGKQESNEMVPDMLKVFDKMYSVSKAKMISVIRNDGKHNEPTWRKEFPLFYRWLIHSD